MTHRTVRPSGIIHAEPGQPSAGAPLVGASYAPIQRPGTDRHLSRHEYGGPTTGRDVRLYIDAQTLSHLAELARSSLSQRVQFDGVGLVVDVYQAPDGHRYEVWTLATMPPKPEPTALG